MVLLLKSLDSELQALGLGLTGSQALPGLGQLEASGLELVLLGLQVFAQAGHLLLHPQLLFLGLAQQFLQGLYH